jgi:hypothetical protein
MKTMEKNEQVSTPKRAQRISPELAEVLKMLSALENRDTQKPDPKAA